MTRRRPYYQAHRNRRPSAAELYPAGAIGAAILYAAIVAALLLGAPKP